MKKNILLSTLLLSTSVWAMESSDMDMNKSFSQSFMVNSTEIDPEFAKIVPFPANIIDIKKAGSRYKAMAEGRPYDGTIDPIFNQIDNNNHTLLKQRASQFKAFAQLKEDEFKSIFKTTDATPILFPVGYTPTPMPDQSSTSKNVVSKMKEKMDKELSEAYLRANMPKSAHKKKEELNATTVVIKGGGSPSTYTDTTVLANDGKKESTLRGTQVIEDYSSDDKEELKKIIKEVDRDDISVSEEDDLERDPNQVLESIASKTLHTLRVNLNKALKQKQFYKGRLETAYEKIKSLEAELHTLKAMSFKTPKSPVKVETNVKPEVKLDVKPEVKPLVEVSSITQPINSNLIPAAEIPLKETKAPVVKEQLLFYQNLEPKVDTTDQGFFSKLFCRHNDKKKDL